LKQLKFHCARAKNFLCFGPEGIELNFNNYGNIVLISGTNYDVEPPRSNGTGKSSVTEILVWGLYGKTVKPPKKIKKNDVVHNKVGKKLEVEILWDKYRVIRTQKPDSLRLWESEENIWDESTEITVGSKAETQKLIEDRVGLNYQTFVNVIVFTDDNKNCFLECDLPEKRKIIENLLGLEIYREYASIAKEEQKSLKDSIKFLMKEYDRLLVEEESSKLRVNQIQYQEKDWRENLEKEMRSLLSKIEIIKEELSNTDEGHLLALWQTSQENLKALSPEIEKYEKGKKKLDDVISNARNNLDSVRDKEHSLTIARHSHEMSIQDLDNKIKKEKEFLELLEKEKGLPCPRCTGVITEESCQHASEKGQEEIDKLSKSMLEKSNELKELDGHIQKEAEKRNKLQGAINQGNVKIKSINNKLIELNSQKDAYASIPKPDVNSQTASLEAELSVLVGEAKKKKEAYKGASPFEEILKNSEEEYQNKYNERILKKKELDEASEILPYYDFWLHGFGDAGIRSFIIEGIVPALNYSVINTLDDLFDGIYKMEFDNELNETIERNPSDGDPYVYHAMSGGEKRSLNLAVSQSFAHVMAINSGALPSAIFLDEVSSNIDAVGVQGIYDIICRLSENKQVFITTHDVHLLNLLEGCDEIKLARRNFSTKLVS
jgi:DNA repair exonuclease SbcCD ATPase subunit